MARQHARVNAADVRPASDKSAKARRSRCDWIVVNRVSVIEESGAVDDLVLRQGQCVNDSVSKFEWSKAHCLSTARRDEALRSWRPPCPSVPTRGSSTSAHRDRGRAAAELGVERHGVVVVVVGRHEDDVERLVHHVERVACGVDLVGECYHPALLVGRFRLVRHGVPVVAHQLTRPARLADRRPWSELDHVRLQVVNGRAVDRVEAPDCDGPTIDGDDLARGDADPIRPTLGPLGEDPDLWPVRVAARVARPDGADRDQRERLGCCRLLDHRRRIISSGGLASCSSWTSG